MGFRARITGTGSAFPKKRFTNDDIVKKLEKFGLKTSDAWIKERTGIHERRLSDIDDVKERNSSLAAAATHQALEMAGRTPEDIDQIIYATCTPDTLIPSSGCWLQKKIGASRAWAMDINAACSGFIYGLVTADQFIRTGKMKTVLVVGAEVMSSIINWEERNSCILFGDGAGVAVVEQVEADSKQCILTSSLSSDGNLWELLYVPAGGSNLETTPERYSKNLHKLTMNGKEIFKIAVRTLAEFAERTLTESRMTIDDLDWFVPHQANIRIIRAVAKRLQFPMEKVLVNVDRYGNTSAATIPTVLDEAIRDGRIRAGQTILLDAFGAGLTYGAVLIRW